MNKIKRKQKDAGQNFEKKDQSLIKDRILHYR